MKNEVNVSTNMLTWAIARAGYELPIFTAKFPDIQSWLKGEKKPTFKQLEDFSKKVHIPFGYLLLAEPPKEQLPITFFRTNNSLTEDTDINIYDTILMLQRRQSWLREYLQENDFQPLPFVGKYRNQIKVDEIVTDIRNTLKLPENWAGQFKTWQDAQENLVSRIEEVGIITVFNGVVGNNGHRKIPVEVCRGFVLVDDFAPFMFINNADWKAAQMFTLIHELAHVWIGSSAGFDFRQLQPANDPTEKLCDKVAAEFLVPQKSFNDAWERTTDIKQLALHFKVSETVIARRALDMGKWTKKDFSNFYVKHAARAFTKKENQPTGGDFYATTRKRLSPTFAAHINTAVKSGKLLYRDAYKLTNLKGDTFENFFSKYF
jgi:Zn-dependent peptidase ImmA (M78 family)